MKKLFLIAFILYFIGVTFGFLVLAQKTEATQGHHGPYPTHTPTSTPMPEVEHHCYECPGWINCDIEDAKEVDCVTPTPEVKQETPPSPFSDGRHSEAPPMPKTGDVVCTTEKPTEAYGLSGKRIDSDTVVLSWTPSGTDHDKQHVHYGRTPDNLEYAYPEDLRPDVSHIDVNGADWGHVWFKVVTWRGNCTKDSLVGDP